MSTSTQHVPQVPPSAPSTSLRVAVREVPETAYRALRANGVSAGEAATAAHAVTEAEITDATGLTTLLAELDHLPVDPVPITLQRGAVDTLVDSAGRGPLLMAPLAADLASTTSQPVLLPAATLTTPLLCLASSTAQRATTPIGLCTLADGVLTDRVIIAPDTSMYRLPAGHTGFDHQTSLTGSGVLFRRLAAPVMPADAPTLRSAAAFAEDTHAALTGGLRVNRQQWTSAHRAAQAFLVPNRPD